MDAYLAIVSKREVRDYTPQPIPEEAMTEILEAGRASGSARNRQPWRFIVLTDRERLRELSAFVARPSNLVQCAAAIAIVLTDPRWQFDTGRAAQNMMLAAWALGIGSCPNTAHDEAPAKSALKVPAEAGIATIISLGYPAAGAPRPRPGAKPDEVLARIDRLPLADLVFRELFRS